MCVRCFGCIRVQRVLSSRFTNENSDSYPRFPTPGAGTRFLPHAFRFRSHSLRSRLTADPKSDAKTLNTAWCGVCSSNGNGWMERLPGYRRLAARTGIEADCERIAGPTAGSKRLQVPRPLPTLRWVPSGKRSRSLQGIPMHRKHPSHRTHCTHLDFRVF